MFGFQRIGDLIWAAADMRVKGFLLGGTAGRTTLAGEGLQHQDGHSHVMALTVPTCKAYDPAYAYEVAVIIEDGLKRMYRDQEDCFYYLTVMNEQYAMPPMPEGVEGRHPARPLQAQAGRGQEARSCRRSSSAAARSWARWSRRSRSSARSTASPPTCGASPATPSSIATASPPSAGTCCTRARRRRCRTSPSSSATQPGVFVAASDYMKILPGGIDRWLPRPMHLLGTDGFGRSESRAALRDYFEVDARFIVFATLTALLKEKKIDAKVVQKAIKDLGINAEKKNPAQFS